MRRKIPPAGFISAGRSQKRGRLSARGYPEVSAPAAAADLAAAFLGSSSVIWRGSGRGGRVAGIWVGFCGGGGRCGLGAAEGGGKEKSEQLEWKSGAGMNWLHFKTHDPVQCTATGDLLTPS